MAKLLSAPKNKFEVGSVSLKGKKPKANNEDSLLSLVDYGLFAVADGMGGYRGGDIASEAATETLKEFFGSSEVDSAQSGASLRRSFEACNFVIHQHSVQNPEFFGMGTTLVALYFGEQLAVAHVGDSRCYRLRNQVFEALTEDHSVLEDEEDENSKRLLSRAVGCDEKVEVDWKELNYGKGDLYLLCSDGLSSFLSDRDMERILNQKNSLQIQAENLAKAALFAGSTDDITVLLVRVV